jgi:hypothetical protein
MAATALGLAVTTETRSIRGAEIKVIGTTGISPKTAVPPAVRDKTSTPLGAVQLRAASGVPSGGFLLLRLKSTFRRVVSRYDASNLMSNRRTVPVWRGDRRFD